MKLIQKYLPDFEYREYRATSVVAPPEVAYRTMSSLDLSDSWVIRAIFASREFLYRIFTKPKEISKPAGYHSLKAWAIRLGWSVLEEVPDRELVVGAVTKPWEAEVVFQGLPGPDFVAFSTPGFAKIAWNIAVKEVKSGVTELSSETRVVLTDQIARSKFRYYWFMFNPGIRLIRWLALRMVKHQLKGKAILHSPLKGAST